MASDPIIPPLNSYSTALVLLPPPHIQLRINPLRSANDKSFPLWTSHLTLVFPFVDPLHLPAACDLIRDALHKARLSPFKLQLDRIGQFKQRGYDTVYLGPYNATDAQRMWRIVSSAVGYSGRAFVPHLTLGQAHHREDSLTFLRNKGQRLLDTTLGWEVGSVIVLRKSVANGGVMEIFAEIPLRTKNPLSPAAVVGLHPTAYRSMSGDWIPSSPPFPTDILRGLTLATLNILSDSNHPTAMRLSRLLSTLLAVKPIPDIVCLQEVTDDFLRHLLGEPSIQARWAWCTHDPTSVLPAEHNIIVLARKCLGFTWEYAHLRGKHKPAVVLRLPYLSEDNTSPDQASYLIIAGLHLTAGLASSQRRTKLEELNTLVSLLHQRHSNCKWILVGDTNIPTSQPIPASVTETFHDAWLTVHGSEEGGATFDPQSNTLAEETAKEDRSSQRYDRVLVRRDIRMKLQAVDKFGQGAEEASDHYGLSVTLQFTDTGDGVAEAPPMARNTILEPAVYKTGGAEGVGSDVEIEEFVHREGGFPTVQQQAERIRVTAALRAALPPPFCLATKASYDSPAPSSAVHFKFIPVGSFGLGVDTQRSDVDILAIGNISPRTFWTLARTRLRKSGSTRLLGNDISDETSQLSVVLKRFVKDASVQMMELLVGNVRVDMQYCSARKLLERWDQVNALPSTDPLFLLPASSLRTLNSYRDMIHLVRVLPPSSIHAFRLAHRALKLFCTSRGIYSSRLGYLGGIHITILLSRVTLLSLPDSSASQLIRAFFATYAGWNWSQEAVTVPGISDQTAYIRSPGREPIVILSIEKPVMNIVQNANMHTTSTIASVFKRAYCHLTAGKSWMDVCGSGGVCGVEFERGFLRSHKYFIKTDLLFWGSSAVKARAWTRYVESRLPHLLVQLQTSFPNWSMRLWPVRLTDGVDTGDMSTGLQSFYLIGFDAPVGSSGTKINAPLLTFEGELRRDERFYDVTEMFVSVSRVASTQLPATIATSTVWSDGGIDPDDDTSDEGEDPELLDGKHDLDTTFAPISSKQIKKNRARPSRGSSTSCVLGTKLRTSADVWNRLMWDRQFDRENYLIGYEDRFEGVKEMSLASWKRDVEDEAFVPFHRVVHFRRKSDQTLIWDRRRKLDLLFGSGMPQEQQLHTKV